MKNQASDREKIFARQISSQGLLSGTCREPFKLKNKKANNPIFKMGQIFE